MSDISKINYSGTDYDIAGNSGSGLTEGVKTALLACFEKVAWVDEDGQDYYDALYNALYPPQNLLSISAVYTQSGTVYNTDTLDSLKSDLVVTANYDDGTSSAVTTYTLSGTLSVGTDTITVSYGGKTATFTVTVTLWTTSPRIAATDAALGLGTIDSNAPGRCYTEPYYYTLPIDAFKQTQYYDSTNNYDTTGSCLWRFTYNFSNASGISFGGWNKTWQVESDETYLTNSTPIFDETEHDKGNDKNSTLYFTLDDNVLGLMFTLVTADKEKCYAYWKPAGNTNLLPVGVTAGDIIFAGSSTQYYGKKNIYD